MPDTNTETFEVNIAHAIPLRYLGPMLPNRPNPRTLRRWHREGMRNRHTDEQIFMPAVESPNHRRELLATIACYEYFVRELNRTEPRDEQSQGQD